MLPNYFNLINIFMLFLCIPMAIALYSEIFQLSWRLERWKNQAVARKLAKALTLTGFTMFAFSIAIIGYFCLAAFENNWSQSLWIEETLTNFVILAISCMATAIRLDRFLIKKTLQ